MLLLIFDDTMQRAVTIIGEAGTQLVPVVDNALRFLSIVIGGNMRRSLILLVCLELKS
jgi:hypothetical protein